MWLSKLVLFNLLFLANHVCAFNILAIISLPLRSHYMAFKILFHELAARGHFVTVINNFPDKNTTNLRYIDLQDQLSSNFTTLEEYESLHPSILNLYALKTHFTIAGKRVIRDCEILLTNANAKAHLEERNIYDVIFVEQFLSDCALAYAGTYFDVPIIGITSHVLLPWTQSQLGIPFNVASDTFYYGTSSPKNSLLSKLESALTYTIIHTYCRPFILEKNLYYVFEKYMPKIHLDVDRIANDKMKMVFANQHYSITGARLLAPQLLEIGGMHITKPKPVPKDIQEFLFDAEQGAIYVSFGSNLRMSSMTPRMLQSILEAFKQLPQKVLLKWEQEDFPPGHNNILWRKWFPQLDVLCHPKVVAFVSHGGMLSTSESAHCGKPILVIPFFGDQFFNGAAARAVGFGKTLLFASITTENLVSTIKELTSSEMQQNAQRVSKQWHDRPQSALESAIYWTEYVARHGNAPPSLPSKHITFFESLLLDVIGLTMLILLLILWLSYTVLKLFRYILFSLLGSLFCRRKEKSL